MSKSGAFTLRAALVGGESYISYNGTTLQPGVLAQPISPIINGILSPYGYTQVLASTTSSVTCPSGDGTGSATKYSGWYLQMTDGTVHSLPSTDVAYGGTSCSSTLSDQVTDGTGWTVTIVGGTYNAYEQTGVTVVSSGGLMVDIATATIQDSQSTPNKINYSEQEFIDTLGMETLVVDGNAFGQLGWFDVNGGNPTESQTFTNSTLKTSFSCSGKADYPATSGTFLTTGIAFPDLTNLGLSWEPNGSDTTGRLAKLTLRTGGTVTYNYNPSSGPNGGLNCTYLVPNKMTRITSDGTTTYTWASYQISGNSYGNTTTVVDNGGNKTVYTFTGLTATGNAASPAIQALTQVQHNQGSSTLLSTDVYCYNGANGQPGNCSTAVVSGPVTEVDVYHMIPNLAAGPSRTQTQYDGGPTGSCATGHGGCYGNVTYSAQYDFGGTSPVRATTVAYGSWNGSSCVAVSSTVHNKPCQIVTTQNGLNVAYSRFTYSSAGNLLIAFLSPNGGSSFLSNPTSNVYNANGTPSTIYDVGGNATFYSYSSSSYVSCGDCTNFPFPTSISKGGLITYSTYNGTGGVKLTEVGPNGSTQQTTTYGYVNSAGTADPFWRLNSITDPLLNKTWKVYLPLNGPFGLTTESNFVFGSSEDADDYNFDGYGRLVLFQKGQSYDGPDYDTVSTSYGWSGNYRSVATSIPCSAGSAVSCTSGITTTLVDPLGRPYTVTDGGGGVVTDSYTQNDVLSVLTPVPSGENKKQTQNQYDGLGRLTLSCAIGSVSGSAACSQNTGSASGVTTSYAYPSNSIGQTGVYAYRGAQTRSKTYDSLGRVVGDSSPEGGNITYVYDSYSSPICGFTGTYSNPGHLLLKTFANGNNECYIYDSLGRLTDVGGELYPNKGTTQCRRFRYDNSKGVAGVLPSGISPQNPFGRMVEAETDDCASTVFTDEWFSYDKDGHVTDMWELTPHSGGYYHSVATYYANGTINTLQLANPSLYTLTYGLDGEGRWNTLTDDSQSIVTATTFNAASQPTKISLLGSTDQDDYTYDPSTGRMTGWTFDVGSNSESGVLTWNPNGTLKSLAITDGFNAGGTQTCDYNTSLATGTGYDDLGRLVGVDCGSGNWGQTFSYDEYDNLTKAVISGRTGITWNPGYSAANNHYNIGSYDGSGNVVADTIHNYTWDSYNKLSTVDSSACGSSGECVTYDAMGRAVEVSKNSAYTEIWYTQLGKTAFMNGSAINYAYAPVPGGGTAYFAGSTGNYYYMHKDWLGNARIVSTINNHSVLVDQGFAPYGEIYPQFGSTASSFAMFTGDTQDVVAGTYETPNRELSANQGRWLLPDPAGSGWNLYAYAANPLSTTDPSGLVTCPGCTGGGPGGGGCDPDEGDCGGPPDPGPPGDPGDPCFFYGLCSGGPTPPPVGPPGGGGCGDIAGFGGPVPDCGGGGTPSKSTSSCAGPNPPVPCVNAANNGPSPCLDTGGAPSPSDYTAQGQQLQNTMQDAFNAANDTCLDCGSVEASMPIVALSTLYPSFRRGGSLDAQAYEGSIAYGNYTYGVYMSAAGFSLGFTLNAANLYAASPGKYTALPPNQFDANYTFTPAVNITNITLGYNDQQNGTVCTPTSGG